MSDHISIADREMNDVLLRDGCVLVDLLSAQDVLTLNEAFQRLAQHQEPGFHSTILSTDCCYRKSVDAAIRALVAPKLQLMLAGYRIAFCTFAVKTPDAGHVSEVPLHQDWSFVDERKYTALGLWTPLIDTTPENGCMQVVRGSHAADHTPRAACTPFLYPELEPILRDEYLISIPMRAGQGLLFDNRLFHCSPPNQTSMHRVAATAVLVPVSAPLRYYHLPDRNQPDRIEIFEVDDKFYLSHNSPSRPENARLVGTFNTQDE